ncbi:hypothetical protein SSAG_02665 [Streptomyces sp. Mg1]|nr:hypothetical protein SSAG_02665 [Streptomyces sp. Mg1]
MYGAVVERARGRRGGRFARRGQAGKTPSACLVAEPADHRAGETAPKPEL